MAELGCLTLGLAPPDLPQGEFWYTRLDDGTLRIDRADPRILISGKLLAEIFIHPVPGVSLGDPQPAENGTPFWEGALLKIAGANRTVIYRILEYVPRAHCYIGEWPD